MNYEYLPEFAKDLGRLSKKRFRSLPEDLETLKKVLSVFPSASQPVSFIIGNIPTRQDVIKIKKFACKSLKGKGANSGIRIIYAFHPEEQKIVFIEMYFKGDKENEDRDRILRYYGK
ncbi:MAG: hypothetical protein PHH14_03050 [Candidatus Margulisbacteria bacterium]|nr:hypothetical protein [Candidatus Margulisiibacteriota bacterium]